MQLFIARDDVARALETEEHVSASVMASVTDLDQQLKDAAVKIDALVGRKTLADWRQSIHPLKSAWWWSLDERAEAAEPGHNPLWTIPAALFFVLSLGVVADTITTLRNGGLNRLSVFGTLMQTLLALLAGSTFLAGGREWMEKLFAQLRINRKVQGWSRVVVALGVLALTFGISVLLPDLVARYRNRQGDQFFKDKQYASAVQSYQQAVALKPSFVKAHFNLALAYDKSHDYPNAIIEYEHSIEFDAKNYTTYNNLARLYILHSRDYDRALRSLDYLRSVYGDLQVDNRYSLHKNSGWAYLELRNYRQAGDEFEWALKQRDGAAAHYLWGRVFDEQPVKEEERQSNREKAKQQWNSFIKAVQDNPEQEEVEPNWKAHAQEQLTRGIENEEKTNP